MLNDDQFVNTVSTAGKSKDANLYIDLRRFSSFISILANHSYNTKIREYQNFGGWVELDLKYIDNWTEKRQANAKHYIDNLRDFVKVPEEKGYMKTLFRKNWEEPSDWETTFNELDHEHNGKAGIIYLCFS